MSSDRGKFLSNVAEKANVPEADAEDLVADFLSALAKTLDIDVLEKVRELVPFSVEIRGDAGRSSLTIEEFLLELSDDERVEEERAATHARAVAGAIRDGATTSQLEELRTLIEDDTLLALFEESRGELTSTPDPSDGEIAQHTPPRSDREESPPQEEPDGNA